MKSPQKKTRNELGSGDKFKQPGSSLLGIADTELESPKPSIGAVKDLSKSVDLSPFKHLDLEGALQSHINSKYELEKYDNITVKESHNQYQHSPRNIFGSPTKSVLRKTIQIGNNPSLRLCHKFEGSMSPTIVSMDKKGYQLLNTPFEIHKQKYQIAKHQRKISEQEYQKTAEKTATERGEKDAQRYLTIPRALRNQGIQEKFIKSREILYKRNMLTQITTKKVFDWTQDKMLVKHKIDEKVRKREAEKLKALRNATTMNAAGDDVGGRSS